MISAKRIIESMAGDVTVLKFSTAKDAVRFEVMLEAANLDTHLLDDTLTARNLREALQFYAASGAVVLFEPSSGGVLLIKAGAALDSAVRRVTSAAISGVGVKFAASARAINAFVKCLKTLLGEIEDQYAENGETFTQSTAVSDVNEFINEVATAGFSQDSFEGSAFDDGALTKDQFVSVVSDRAARKHAVSTAVLAHFKHAVR